VQYLIVKNWRDHQHYKKRSPPWIKLHRAIIEDYAFATLKDKTKAHLMLIWVLASGCEGRIPNDAKFIASKISATEPVDLDAIIEAGFLVAENSEEPALETKLNGAKHPVLADTGEVIERIPMIGGEEFEVRESFSKELERLYPNVDIPATLRQMRGWCLGNPQKLKTPRGIRKFITGWCERDQNGR
jgi:hypothetical protein